MKKDYDVVIIGGGIIGCSIARFLSRFNVKAILLERHNDVGDETTCANSAIVHSGYDPHPGTLKAKFNVLGNQMMPKIAEELDVPFIKNGSLTVSFSDEEDETLLELLERAKVNHVKARIVEHDELMKMEPNLNPDAHKAILCEDAGIISPFNLCVNMMENAMDNGIELGLNTNVLDIKKNDKGYIVITEKGDFETKVVVNAAGLNSDKFASILEDIDYHVIPRRGEYYILDHFDPHFVNHVLFMCPTKVGKGVLVSPTTSHNYIVGPTNEDSDPNNTSTEVDVLAALRASAAKLIPNIPYQFNIRQFSGVRANSSTGDFVIEESKKNPGFYNLACIMSPGLASSPAIGLEISNMIKEKLGLKENPNYNPCIRPHLRFTKMSKEEYNELVKKNPQYGHFICRCEQVTEGEIVDCINRNCGAHTVKGVKKRVRPGFGRCQGTFCESEVMKVLERELKVDIQEINYSDLGTEIMKFNVKAR